MKKLIKKIWNWRNRNNTVKTPMRKVFNRIDPLQIGMVTSRYGDSRVISQIATNVYQVEGHSLYSRGANREDGAMEMFDFEGGPCYVLGQRFPLKDSPTVITELRCGNQSARSGKPYSSVIVTVAEI